jgi:BASS family bile acid:Na+ symporter
VQIALLALAVSPVPPFLPIKGGKLGARNPYMYGLLVEMALLAVVATPLAIVMLGRAFGLNTYVPPFEIAVVVSRTVLLPLGLGMLVRAMSPGFADRISGPIALVTKIVLALGVLLLLMAGRHLIAGLLSDGTLAAMAAFTIAGVIVGHLLGGPVDEDRTFLAIATSARHPGVALAAAHAVAPDQQKLVVAAILLYLVVNALVTAPYARWRKRGIPMARATTLAPR